MTANDLIDELSRLPPDTIVSVAVSLYSDVVECKKVVSFLELNPSEVCICGTE
jgi:hypothetical protein